MTAHIYSACNLLLLDIREFQFMDLKRANWVNSISHCLFFCTENTQSQHVTQVLTRTASSAETEDAWEGWAKWEDMGWYKHTRREKQIDRER